MIVVSVVIPTHRRPDLLRQALKALVAQAYPLEQMEVIVVATENDPAFSVVEEINATTPVDVKCVSIPNDPTAGKSASAKRNHGAQLAQGEWLAFTDDDCVPDIEWIRLASAQFGDARVGGIEGNTMIPPADPPTLTYKGMLQLGVPGGFQTCNMFYRRSAFLEVEGFDPRFPFYLEDTDLAWSVQNAGHEIVHNRNASVTHPLLPPRPWRLLDDAKRTKLLALLRAKHPDLFHAAGMKPLRPVHVLFLILYGGAMLGFLVAPAFLWLSVAGLALLTVAHAARLFWGCRVEFEEVVVTTVLLPIVPVVRLVQYLRGRMRYRNEPPARRPSAA